MDNFSDRFKELGQEFKVVFAGRGNIVDAFIPPIIFLILNAILGFDLALWGSLISALFFGVFRLLKHQPLRYALGGVGGILLAVLIAKVLGRAEGFFVPGLISGGVTVALCLVTVMIKRPLVAWTSFLARRWPLEWYWHDQVRPAYSEVTFVWGLFFGLRLLFQYQLFQQQATQLLGLTQLITGWPATMVLLVASYIYGIWRLQNLSGPSVDEFKTGSPPPWEGQKRGF